MLAWRLTLTAASMQTEPIIHLFLEAFALPVGPLHILSSNQQETGDPVRLECHAKQCLSGREVLSFGPSITPRKTSSFASPDSYFISAFSSERSPTLSAVTEKTGH